MELAKLNILLDDPRLGEKKKKLEELARLLEHLPIEVPIRQQKEYEISTQKARKVIEELFGKIDLTNTRLLHALLETVKSYGYFRIARITFSLESQLEEIDESIDKVKWYDLTPLLPEAGEIGWKGLITHCFVKEEKELFQVSLSLLTQKLHYYTILSTSVRLQSKLPTLIRNGKKVVERLFEMIQDISRDDEDMIGMNTFLFNLMMPYADEDQQSALVEAIVQDLFKPFVFQVPSNEEHMAQLHDLTRGPIMNQTRLQDIFTAKLLEVLKCNIIRRKRRHSVEASIDGTGTTLESILESIIGGVQPTELLPKFDEISLSSKTLQSGFIEYWVTVLSKAIPPRGLTVKSSIVIMNVCFSLLATASSIASLDLNNDISFLLAKAVENTSQDKLNELFRLCDPVFLIEFTKFLGGKTQLLNEFDSPLRKFYGTYLNRYLRSSLMRNSKPDAEKIEEFISSISDKDEGLHKDTIHLLQYICVKELSSFFQDTRKANNKSMEVYSECFSKCAKRMYKFLKRNLSPSVDVEMETEDFNQSMASCSSLNDVPKRTIVIDSLVCILKAAIDKKDQNTLDMYGELLRKLYILIEKRVEQLVELTRTGSKSCQDPLDPHLYRLIILYSSNTDSINPYLNFDLIDKLSHIITPNYELKQNGSSQKDTKGTKKQVYTELKSKLEALEDRAKNFSDVYSTIINKQYNNVIEQSLSSTSDIKKEKSCFSSYSVQMRAMAEISRVITKSCGAGIYERVLEKTVEALENCDPLDHPGFLYIVLIFESLIARHSPNTAPETVTFIAFKKTLPRVSCSLIRISKSVELGPSIRAFTKSSAHKSNKAIQCCTYSACIKVYTQMFLHYPPKVTDQFMTDAMQICISANLMQYSKYSTRLQKHFVQLASSIAGLLKSVCIGRKEKELVGSSMPIFLSVFSNLIRCLIIASDRLKLEKGSDNHEMNGQGSINVDMNGTEGTSEGTQHEEVNKTYETQLELLAIDIGKTLNSLSFLKVKLIDYAPHLISTYIKDIQRASCPDFVRIHLNEGIFRIFNLVDAHQRERQDELIEDGVQRKTSAGHASGSLFEMIHARLDQASREIFRDMHENYNKFHRYVGKC